MNRLKLGVAVLALLVMPRVAAAQTDLSGTWLVSLETPQGKMELETTLTQDGEKLSGQLTSPMGAVDFTGTFVKNALSILYSVPIQGQVIDIRMTGSVEGDALSGMVDLGGLMQAPWSAKRKPATAAAAAATGAAPATNGGAPAAREPGSVTGKWNLTVQMGANALPLTATLTQDGETVTGSIQTPFGALPATGTMVGTALTLQFTAPMPQGPMNVTMNGQLGPNGLSGKSTIAGVGEGDWSATRAD
jgi:hypothetical protein